LRARRLQTAPQRAAGCLPAGAADRAPVLSRSCHTARLLPSEPTGGRAVPVLSRSCYTARLRLSEPHDALGGAGTEPLLLRCAAPVSQTMCCRGWALYHVCEWSGRQTWSGSVSARWAWFSLSMLERVVLQDLQRDGVSSFSCLLAGPGWDALLQDGRRRG
jgi:hypothetical protein